MRIQVLVRLKPDVLDVQGKAIERAIAEGGVADVSAVRVGKLIELDLPVTSVEQARELLAPLCRSMLANTVIEDFEIRAVGDATGAGR